MNVLLIDPPGWQKHSLNLGLAYLAGSAHAEGITVRILDMNNRVYSADRINKFVSEFAPRVIGLSLKTATADSGAAIIRMLKKTFPHIVYVAGGPHMTLCGSDMMRANTEIDFGISGEGEVPFAGLLKRLRDGAGNVCEIDGLYYRNNGDVALTAGNISPDVTRLPLPAFDCIKDMDLGGFRYPLLTSRGCPYGCIFCCVGIISGRKWRGRSAQDVVDELVSAQERYGISSFEIMDDNFTFDIGRAKEICSLIIKKKLGLDWWCHNGLRADRLDRELVYLMKKAGCSSIALGIESGDAEVFRSINKGEELSDIVNAVRMIRSAGIRCVGYFIVGLPGESVESTKRSVRFQRGLRLSDHKYNMLIPYPGTRIWDMVKEKGRLLTDISGFYHFGDNIRIPFETDALSRQTLEDCMHLAENQQWVSAEKDIAGIKEGFYVRYGRAIERILLMENGGLSLAKNLAIEFKQTSLLRVQCERVADEPADTRYLHPVADGDYFDALRAISAEEGYNVIFDPSTRKVFLRKDGMRVNEYVRGEVLPSSREWDGSAKRYYATRLKCSSPDTNAARNGIIYKDGIALPFSPCPQWEKVPCGKIESGLAFISRAALNPASRYTADYMAIKDNGRAQGVACVYTESRLAERIMSETDILFAPESLRDFLQVFSRAKSNVLYSTPADRGDSIMYEAREYMSRTRLRCIQRIAGRLAEIRRAAGVGADTYAVFTAKAVRVISLWIQIIFYEAAVSLKNVLSRIVRF